MWCHHSQLIMRKSAFLHYLTVSPSVVSLDRVCFKLLRSNYRVCLPPPSNRLHCHIFKKKKTFYVDCHISFHFKLVSHLLWLTRRRWLRDSNLLWHCAAAQPPQTHADTSRLAEQKSNIYGFCSRFASQQKWKLGNAARGGGPEVYVRLDVLAWPNLGASRGPKDAGKITFGIEWHLHVSLSGSVERRVCSHIIIVEKYHLFHDRIEL